MKIIGYILLAIAIFAIGFAATYLFLNSKMKNTESLVIITPFPQATNQITSAFSLENAPSESLRGTIATMAGEIDWTSRTATQAAQILSPIQVQQGEELSTGVKSSLSLDFPEACSVKFSQSTDIQIIQTLPSDLVFAQLTGSAEYTKSGSDPVSVRALNLLTEVGGNTDISMGTARPTITLTVKSGSATVAYDDLKYISHEITIPAGHIYTFNSGTRRGVVK
jgi:hypothetical protein